MRHILLDSTPLGIISNPANTPEVIAITNWAAACLSAGHKIYIPEVIDYEVRRELIRAGKTPGIAKLNRLESTLRYVPLTTPAMLLAAELWAQTRNRGLATGDPKKLDIDMILVAQALALGIPAAELVIATTNVRHLGRFLPADLWANIMS